MKIYTFALGVAILFSLLFSIGVVEAKAECDIQYVEGEFWNYVILWPEKGEEHCNPNTVVIYLHGNGNNGIRISDLSVMRKVNHPLQYAEKGILEMPDDVIFVCPQAHENREFRDNQNTLAAFIENVASQYLDAKIVLAGHSNGANAAYKFAVGGNSQLVDAYAFISCNIPAECGDNRLSNQDDIFIAYGSEEDTCISLRVKTFQKTMEHDIGGRVFTQAGKTVYERNENRVYTVGKWSHGYAPRVLLEDIFWEWMSNLT